MIPVTPHTLLDTLARVSAQDDAHWARFDDLYRPVIKFFIRQRGLCREEDVDDAAQDVFVRLVDILRNRRYDRAKGSFHSYLSVVVNHILVDRFRRRSKLAVVPGDLEENKADCVADPAPDVRDRLERQWQESCYQAALRHVLNKTPLPVGYREVFIELAHGADPADLAVRHNLTPAAVRQIRHRVNGRIAAHMRLLAGDDL